MVLYNIIIYYSYFMAGLTPHFRFKLDNFITVLLQDFTSEVFASYATSTSCY